MSALSIALSEEAEKGILANIERGLFEYVVSKRSAELENLFAFSIEEIAEVKGWALTTARRQMSKLRVAVEDYGPNNKRFPIRELRRVFDEATIKNLKSLRTAA